jgi:hypothetical protein
LNKSNWQDDVSAREWDERQKLARKFSKSKNQATSLGAEDYAARAIEKRLVGVENRMNGLALATSDSLSLEYLLERLNTGISQARIRVAL